MNGRGGGLVSERDVATVRSAEIEEDIYALKGENLDLKRRLNGQDDKTKKLLTRVQRLTEDLKRARDTGGRGKVVVAKHDPETDSLIDELRTQLSSASKLNSQLKNKASYWKNMHEQQSRKRTPYDHVGPRFNAPSSGATTRRLVPAMAVRGNNVVTRKAGGHQHAAVAMEDQLEEVEKLQELVGMLRSKLANSEGEIEALKDELKKARDVKESHSLQDDIDRIALQKELADTKRRLGDARGRHESLEERIKGLMEIHEEAVKAVEELNDQLKEEKRANFELQGQLKEVDLLKRTEKELNEIIKDLRAEKKLLEEEMRKLVETALRNRETQLDDDVEDEEEYLDLKREVERLHSVIAKLERQIEEFLKDKKDYLSRIEILSGELSGAQIENSRLSTEYDALKAKYDELKEQLRWIKEGPIPWGEIEEALAFIRARKEKGLGLDGLVELDELEQYKRLLEELRVQYADCVQELNKTRKMLELQQDINKEYKAENEDLRRKMEALRNEYELRLEEDARLLDLRSHKIAMLEAQLKNFVYGTSKLPETKAITDDEDDNIQLEPGQNLLEITVGSALISPEGLETLDSLGLGAFLNLDTPSQLTTFVAFDFYDFETMVTSLGMGLRPSYNYAAKFKVFVDDFFLYYLQTKRCRLEFCGSTGVEWAKLASCNIMFRDLVEPGRTDKITFYADLISTHDEKTIIGKIEYSLRIRVPMSQAIRQFKERTVALNLLTVSTQDEPNKRFQPRAEENTLLIKIEKCNHLRNYAGVQPAVYAAYKFFQSDDTMTNTASSTNPVFANHVRHKVLMSSDLDRYLRTRTLDIAIIDDTDKFGGDFVYGVAKIPLEKLALNESVIGEYEIRSPSGVFNGTVTVSFTWEKSYKLDITPVVSKLDSVKTAKEFETFQVQQEEVDVSVSVSVTQEEDITMEESISIQQHEDVLSEDVQLSIVTKKEELSETVEKVTEMGSDALPPVHPSSDKDESLKITIETLQFDHTNPEVSYLLGTTSQIFIGYDFLNLPPEQLESPSIPILDGKMSIHFSKFFDLNNASVRNMITGMLKSNDKFDHTLVFNIVSEPPPQSKNEECVDLALCELDLKELVKDGEVELMVRDLEGTVRMGTMKVVVQGVKSLKALAV